MKRELTVRNEERGIVSFSVPASIKLKLMELERYTVFVSNLVVANLGICPTCGGKWKRFTGKRKAACASEAKP